MGKYSQSVRVCSGCAELFATGPDSVWRETHYQAGVWAGVCSSCGCGFSDGLAITGAVVWVDEMLEMARKRGEDHATHDRNDGECRPTPLSGEWASESVHDMLGDLIDALGDDYAGDVCDAYESGYAGVWSDVDFVDVCADCAQVLANGVCNGWEDSPDETRERPAGVFPYCVDGAWPTDDVTTFSKFPCECCGSRLAGSRVRVVVWVSPDQDFSGV